MVQLAHEYRSLNPHIEDIARRLALDNFIAAAPDALFPLGGYRGDDDKARDLFGKLDQTWTREDFVSAAAYALSITGGNGKLGCVDLCYGGGMVNLLATRVPKLLAGAPFYGAPAPSDRASRINAAWPAYEVALKSAGVRHAAFKYAGTQHGFNNDTTPRFDAAAAQLAWARTLALFDRTLR